MKSRMANRLVRVAREVGADPRCGTFTPVPIEVWDDLQVYDSGRWVTLEGLGETSEQNDDAVSAP